MPNPLASWYVTTLYFISISNLYNNHIDKAKIFDDKEAERKTLEEAKRCNWRQCPSCGHLVERKVLLINHELVNIN